jgi:hypothetical protein
MKTAGLVCIASIDDSLSRRLNEMIDQQPALPAPKPKQTNVVLTPTAREALRQLQEYYGLTQTSVIEVLLREEVRRERLDGSRPVPLRWRRRSA